MIAWWKAPSAFACAWGSSRFAASRMASRCSSRLRERLVVDLQRCGARGDTFERGANRINLEEIVCRDLANLRAAERRADDEPEQLEIAQRFANGPLADTELLRDACLDDARAGRQPAVQDVFDEFLANLFPEDAPLERPALVVVHAERLGAWRGCTGGRRLRWRHYRLSIMLDRFDAEDSARRACLSTGSIMPQSSGEHVGVDYSSFGLHDKIAVVTGASQGIGRAIALGFAQAGAHLVLAKHPSRPPRGDRAGRGRDRRRGPPGDRRADRRLSRRPGARHDRRRRKTRSAASTSSSTTPAGPARRRRSTSPRTSTTGRWPRR